MQQPNWVPATDLALGDEIRFEQRIWDGQRRAWTGASQIIQGTIVKLTRGQLTLATVDGPLTKKLRTIAKGGPIRLDREDREPEITLAKSLPRRPRLDEWEDLHEAIERDNERDRRLARQNGEPYYEPHMDWH